MKKEILFYWKVMQHGRAKGKVSTFDQKIKYIARNILYYTWAKKSQTFCKIILISAKKFIDILCCVLKYTDPI